MKYTRDRITDAARGRRWRALANIQDPWRIHGRTPLLIRLGWGVLPLVLLISIIAGRLLDVHDAKQYRYMEGVVLECPPRIWNHWVKIQLSPETGAPVSATVEVKVKARRDVWRRAKSGDKVRVGYRVSPDGRAIEIMTVSPPLALKKKGDGLDHR